MKKTPPGTRALIRKYLKAVEKKEICNSLWTEEEIAVRIGSGNAIVLDGKIISAHQGEITEGKTSRWIFIHERIGLDDEDDKIPTIKTLFDEIEKEDELEIKDLEKPKKDKKRGKKKKKKTVML